MNCRPRNLPETLEVASKGFVMGVALGLSGIVTCPIRGKHYERSTKRKPIITDLQ